MAQYRESLNERFFREHLDIGWPWRMLVFTLMLFLAAVLSYLGLTFGYQPYLEDSIAKTESELNSLSLQVSADSKEDFIAFYSQLVNLKSLLDKHIAVSKLLPLLEQQTSRKVAYSSATILAQEKTLRLEGLAESYQVLAAQLALFEQAPWVEKVILDDSSLSEKNVKFDLRLIIKDEAINL
jgi:hypothetical protein